MSEEKLVLKKVKFIRSNGNYLTFVITSETDYRSMIQIEQQIDDYCSSILISNHYILELYSKSIICDLVPDVYYDIELIAKKLRTSINKIEYKITKIVELEHEHDNEVQSDDEEMIKYFDLDEVNDMYDKYIKQYDNIRIQMDEIRKEKSLNNVNKMINIFSHNSE